MSDVPDIEFPVLHRVKRISQDYARKYGPKKVKPVDIILQVGSLIAGPALAGRGIGAALEESLSSSAIKPDLVPYQIPIENIGPRETITTEVGSSFTAPSEIPSNVNSFVNPSFEELPIEDDFTRLAVERLQKPNTLKTRYTSSPKPGRARKRGEVIELHQISPNSARVQYSNIEETIFQKPAARTRATQNFRDISLGGISDINESINIPLLSEGSSSVIAFDEIEMEPLQVGFRDTPTTIEEEAPDGLQITVPKSTVSVEPKIRKGGGRKRKAQQLQPPPTNIPEEDLTPSTSGTGGLNVNTGGHHIITKKKKKRQRKRKIKKSIFSF